MKTGRNDPCPCGSGKKYKKCCLGKEEERKVQVRNPARKESRVDFTGMDYRQLIEHGYAVLGKKDSVHACRLWWLAWRKLKAVIRENGARNVVELDTPPGWFRDMERETAGVMDKRWVFAVRRLVFAEEFLELLPDSDASVLDDMRRAVAGSREFLDHLENRPEIKVVQAPKKEKRKGAGEISAAQAWADAFDEASKQEQYELFMAIARQPEEFKDELDLGEFAVEVFGRLETNNLQEQALELAGALQANWPDYYAGEYYYFDSFLANRALYLGEPLSGALRRFAENPVDGVDYLLPLFGSLVAYQHRDVAIALAEQVFPVMRSSLQLIRQSEYDFGLAVFADRLEKAYEKRIDWSALNEAVKPFDFEIEPEMARDLDTLWSDGFAVEDLMAELDSDFGRALALLGFGFCSAMREQKGMCFPCALLIWSQFEGLFDGEPDGEEHFDFALEALEDKVAGQLGLRFLGLSNRKTDAIVLVWGLPYVYDYLYSLGLIDAGLHAGVLDKVMQVKEQLFEGIGGDLWIYDFVRRWQPPDSTDEDFRTYEARVFEHSFRRRVPLA